MHKSELFPQSLAGEITVFADFMSLAKLKRQRGSKVINNSDIQQHTKTELFVNYKMTRARTKHSSVEFIIFVDVM
jgi:hypothetical protein